jgi:hypothetical protein
MAFLDLYKWMPGGYQQNSQLTLQATPVTSFWTPLLNRLAKTKTRGASAEWLSTGFGEQQTPPQTK